MSPQRNDNADETIAGTAEFGADPSDQLEKLERSTRSLPPERTTSRKIFILQTK